MRKRAYEDGVAQALAMFKVAGKVIPFPSLKPPTAPPGQLPVEKPILGPAAPIENIKNIYRRKGQPAPK